jgi:hypothetical protein
MLSGIYAEWHLCSVAFMLSGIYAEWLLCLVAYKPIMQSVAVINGVKLNVIHYTEYSGVFAA